MLCTTYSPMSVSETLGNYGSNCLLVVHKILTVHVEKVMAIVLLCESAQQFRALMMILQYHKTLSMMLSQCSVSCFRDIPGLVSCVFFR